MALKQQPSSKPALSTKTLIYGISSVIAVAAIVMGVLGIEGIEEIEASQSFTNVAISGAGNAGTDIAISISSDGGFALGDINDENESTATYSADADGDNILNTGNYVAVIEAGNQRIQRRIEKR